ncbi:helix-turn-helix domain-containing protein [Pontimicrobium sp. IMCC45349]|uniref:helix-turn-helix domain-containing protein n=1 Tax=Pontimicrobium sp. IMCC45349 TaxID=3391574 RepID=UPI0039A3A1DF
MVNNSDFIKRLEKVMKYYSLSASAFAEKIGVQRSSISHILSGRNKPSLEFTMKILTSFPEVDLYWLLNGKGNFPKEEENKQSIDSTSNFTNQVQTKIQNPTPTNSEIERIVIFYKDGSFKNFEN